jgi:hypothetical protein
VNIVEGNGVSTCDNPTIEAQMLSKHPQSIEEWIPIPRRADNADSIALQSLASVVSSLDPDTGTATRCLRPDYITKLFKGNFSSPLASSAADLFTSLGVAYLEGTLPDWARTLLAGGLLTPLNKDKPHADNAFPDARPVKAEDSDTACWCKALAQDTQHLVRAAVIPQQLGVGVQSGVPMYLHGLKLTYSIAARDGTRLVFVKIDIRNAHNEFSRLALRDILSTRVAAGEPDLSPLLLGLQSTLGIHPAIYARSTRTPTGFRHLCDSCRGGGQGNALTGAAFTLAIDPTLKNTEIQFPTVTVKADQDDITMFGPPEDIFTDAAGTAHALEYMLSGLASISCVIQESKCQVLGTSPDCYTLMPTNMKRPFVSYIDATTGEMRQANGFEVCNTAIGEDEYVRNYLSTKSHKCSQRILDTTAALAPLNAQAAHSVVHYSCQNRLDYLCGTHTPYETTSLVREVEAALAECYRMVFGGTDLLNTTAPLYDPSQRDPSFTRDRFCSRTRFGGGGFRPMQQRTPFLTTLNQVIPQMLHRTDSAGHRIEGLWHTEAMISTLGENSFDHPHQATRWHCFLQSNLPLATAFIHEYDRLQQLRSDTIAQLPPDFQPAASCFDDGIEGFGASTTHLQRDIFTHLAPMVDIALLTRAKALTRSDPRRMSYLATRQNGFANVLLRSVPTSEVPFSNMEWYEAVSNLFGKSSPSCSHFLGARIASNRNCPQLHVDRYGHNLKTATGLPGDHIRDFHDQTVAIMCHHLSLGGFLYKGGQNRPCKSIFSHLFPPNVTEDAQRILNGIIPDAEINAHTLPPPSLHCKLNPFENTTTLVDVKTYACGRAYSEHDNSDHDHSAVTRREKRVDTDYRRKAHTLDAQFYNTPQGTVGPFQQQLNCYGINGTVIGLVVGAFAEASTGIIHLRDLIARALALRLTGGINISLEAATGIYRDKLTRIWGLHFARGWSRVLLGRLAHVVPDPSYQGGARGARASFAAAAAASMGSGMNGGSQQFRPTIDPTHDGYDRFQNRHHDSSSRGGNGASYRTRNYAG